MKTGAENASAELPPKNAPNDGTLLSGALSQTSSCYNVHIAYWEEEKWMKKYVIAGITALVVAVAGIAVVLIRKHIGDERG